MVGFLNKGISWGGCGSLPSKDLEDRIDKDLSKPGSYR